MGLEVYGIMFDEVTMERIRAAWVLVDMQFGHCHL